ncbi:MAG: CD1375 family protein [Butyricicoccus sp.]
MTELYYNLVLAHKRTCNSENTEIKLVPATVRAAVLELLEANGYDADGNAAA